MKTLEDVLKAMMKESGLNVKDEEILKLIKSLNNLFQYEWERIEVEAAIREVTEALKQKNKMLYGSEISDDLGNRELIDPNILKLRLQGLEKLLKKVTGRK